MLLDYFYVDQRRLDNYFAQISNPIAYDKVAGYKTSLSLTGPKAEATQTRVARSYSTHEKISMLLKYLETQGEIVQARFAGPLNQSKAPFHLETCHAHRVSIPSKYGQAEKDPAITLWLSPGETSSHARLVGDNPAKLYLIEDNKREDSSLTSWSGYSALLLLKEQFDDEFRRSFVGTSLADLNDPRGITRSRFSTTPLALLAEMGAQVGPERKIQTLYKVRATFMDEDSEPEFIPSTVGYPIFIAD